MAQTQVTPRTVRLIGYASGWGAADAGCGDGPLVCRKKGLEKVLSAKGADVAWYAMIEPTLEVSATTRALYPDGEARVPLVKDVCERLAAKTEHAMRHGHFPLILGGDHSSAAATWSGVVTAMGAEGRFGLIWLDAHMDAHTPLTRHEGKWGGHLHGQPLAALLGEGEAFYLNLGSSKVKLSPENVTLIGVRSFEPGEEAFLKRKGVKVYDMAAVERLGFKAVFADALTRATTDTAGYGLSIDMDGFQPDEAPGVGTPEENGLKMQDVLPALQELATDKRLKAVELVEYNPYNDVEDKTYHLLSRLAETFCA